MMAFHSIQDPAAPDRAPKPASNRLEIRRDSKGEVDEVVARRADLVHLEMLDRDSAFIAIHTDAGVIRINVLAAIPPGRKLPTLTVRAEIEGTKRPINETAARG